MTMTHLWRFQHEQARQHMYFFQKQIYKKIAYVGCEAHHWTSSSAPPPRECRPKHMTNMVRVPPHQIYATHTQSPPHTNVG